ncbi:hypothetical protein Fmac_028443 [Flemingia macrophylla]|uniref:Uncharacterized protein n=1 Tax=Flemingia macrophylla TaxID=520843 RepID=A0ABD1L7J1_9FABA
MQVHDCTRIREPKFISKFVDPYYFLNVKKLVNQEGIHNPRYKGFYTKEEVEKALELDTIDPKVIKEALNPDPEVLIINPDGQGPRKSYKDCASKKTQQELDFKNFLTLQKFLTKSHKDQKAVPGLNFKPTWYAIHVIKLVSEDHKDFPVLYNDTFDNLEIQGNSTYQFNLLCAQIMDHEWFFNEAATVEYNLLKETFDTKLYFPDNLGKMFIPFPIETNNKLVQYFQKEKKNKEIYEASGCFGQNTPTNDSSMSETSEIHVEEDFEDISVTNKA